MALRVVQHVAATRVTASGVNAALIKSIASICLRNRLCYFCHRDTLDRYQCMLSSDSLGISPDDGAGLDKAEF